MLQGLRLKKTALSVSLAMLPSRLLAAQIAAPIRPSLAVTNLALALGNELQLGPADPAGLAQIAADYAPALNELLAHMREQNWTDSFPTLAEGADPDARRRFRESIGALAAAHAPELRREFQSIDGRLLESSARHVDDAVAELDRMARDPGHHTAESVRRAVTEHGSYAQTHAAYLRRYDALRGTPGGSPANGLAFRLNDAIARAMSAHKLGNAVDAEVARNQLSAAGFHPGGDAIAHLASHLPSRAGPDPGTLASEHGRESPALALPPPIQAEPLIHIRFFLDIVNRSQAAWFRQFIQRDDPLPREYQDLVPFMDTWLLPDRRLRPEVRRSMRAIIAESPEAFPNIHALPDWHPSPVGPSYLPPLMDPPQGVTREIFWDVHYFMLRLGPARRAELVRHAREDSAVADSLHVDESWLRMSGQLQPHILQSILALADE